MNRRNNAKNGIWIIIINREIYDEYYNEKEAISEFEMLLEDEEFKNDDMILSRVLRTTEINEYPNLETIGDWRIYPSLEEDDLK